MNVMIIPIALPVLSAMLLAALPERTRYVKELLSVMVTAVAMLAAFTLLPEALLGNAPSIKTAWAGFGLDFALRADQLSVMLLCAVSGFSFVIALYSFSFENKGPAKWFYFNLLLTQGFAAGAVLADNLVAMLFFWEGLLVMLYTFIALSQPGHASKSTAMKAFVINAVTDLCLLVGVAITGYIAGTMSMQEISGAKLTLDGWAALGYVLMLIGALSKAGAIPFHTWIPDAATDSSAPFMAYVPAAIDKLLGIYFLARISVYMFALGPGMQIFLMAIGSLTIIIAVMMAFVQNDYKRLLSYHAVSQTGYMILGIGTLNPVGIMGGLFHMFNHATYKSCLFMTAGSVERRTGTNDLSKLGGLFRAMPVTGLCFLIAAAAISGIAPLNGFFSKELVYKGTLATGYKVFFLAAEIGSILTLASFLKLGHSVFFGKRPEGLGEVKEAPFSTLLPMMVLAGVCVAFGFGAAIPDRFVLGPIVLNLGLDLPGSLSGFHFDELFWASVAVILIAAVNHMFGLSAAGGEPHKASDHIHYAPVLKETYELAEHKVFDPYEQVMKRLPAFANLLYKADRAMDWVIDSLPTMAANGFAKTSQRFHNGSYPAYMALAALGFLLYIIATATLGGVK